MPRPGVGNPGNRGPAKGSGAGRKSAYQEKQDAEWHVDVWKNRQNKPKLDAKIATGKFAGREMALWKLLEGDKYVIGKFMDKLVPDLHDVKSGGQPLQLNIVNYTDVENGDQPAP